MLAEVSSIIKSFHIYLWKSNQKLGGTINPKLNLHIRLKWDTVKFVYGLVVYLIDDKVHEYMYVQVPKYLER